MNDESEKPKRLVPRFTETQLFRPYFYYIRNSIGQKIFTVCLLVRMNDFVIGRGVAVCSSLDQFDKKIGRAIAQGRARKAFEENSTGRPMLRTEVIELSNECKAPMMFKSFISYQSPNNGTEEKIFKAIDKLQTDEAISRHKTLFHAGVKK
jgi:hypothetical protein